MPVGEAAISCPVLEGLLQVKKTTLRAPVLGCFFTERPPFLFAWLQRDKRSLFWLVDLKVNGSTQRWLAFNWVLDVKAAIVLPPFGPEFTPELGPTSTVDRRSEQQVEWACPLTLSF